MLKTAALGLASLPLVSCRRSESSATAAPAASPLKEGGLRFGLASYSTRMLSLDETIATAKVLRLAHVSLYKAHCNWETATVEECRAAGEKLRAAGIGLSGSGVTALPNDEAKLRRIFENVRAAGMATMVCKPEPAVLPLVEKFVKEFDQKIAIHNHGPEDKIYPSPASVWAAVQPFDQRIGLCLDVGHAMRAGADPVAAVGQYASRLYDLHLKDSLAISGAMDDIPVEIGTGRIDIRGILRALIAVKYSGVVAFEYEKTGGNPVTGLAESVGYVRGMLAALPS